MKYYHVIKDGKIVDEDTNKKESQKLAKKLKGLLVTLIDFEPIAVDDYSE